MGVDSCAAGLRHRGVNGDGCGVVRAERVGCVSAADCEAGDGDEGCKFQERRSHGPYLYGMYYMRGAGDSRA